MFADFFLAHLGRESLISADDTWALLVLMVASVALAIWLEQKYVWASKISGAIIALLIALAAVLLSVFVVIWALILSVLAAALAVGVSAVALVLAAIFGYLKISGFLLTGLALICVGLCLLTGLLAAALCRAAVRGGKWLWRQIKKLLVKKEG